MSIFRLYDLCVCIYLKISMLRKPLKFVLKTGELKCRNLVAQEKVVTLQCQRKGNSCRVHSNITR